MITKYLTIAFVVLIITTASPAQHASPVETAKSFYQYSNAHSTEFNKRHVELRKQWYTPSLYRAFQEQLRKDATQKKQHPTDKPFFGDGLDFAPLNEPCEANGKSFQRSISFSSDKTGKSLATVNVKFAYPKACADGSEPIVFKVKLLKVSEKWLIADWIYPDGKPLTQEIEENKYNK
jgi:hypothetical protein